MGGIGGLTFIPCKGVAEGRFLVLGDGAVTYEAIETTMDGDRVVMRIRGLKVDLRRAMIVTGLETTEGPGCAGTGCAGCPMCEPLEGSP